VPIPGTRSAARVAENVAAASMALTADDLAQIARILPDGGFGARFPAGRFPVWE
jgi:aryl-alcohol dehydrogenase-like predicted oxidoreductase